MAETRVTFNWRVFFEKQTLVIFPHRYLDRNKLAKVPLDAFSELTNLKYV